MSRPVPRCTLVGAGLLAAVLLAAHLFAPPRAGARVAGSVPSGEPGAWKQVELSPAGATIATSPDQRRSLVVWLDPNCTTARRPGAGCIEAREARDGMLGPARVVVRSKAIRGRTIPVQAQVADSGAALVTWTQSGCCVWAASRAAGGTAFGPSTPVSPPGEQIDSPVTAVSSAGAVGVAWDTGDELQAAFGRAGSAIGPPEPVPSATGADTFTLSLAAGGADLVSLVRNSSPFELIDAMTRSPQGRWTSPHRIGAVPVPFYGAVPIGLPLEGVLLDGDGLYWRAGGGSFTPLGTDHPIPFGGVGSAFADSVGQVALDPGGRHALLAISDLPAHEEEATLGVAAAVPGGAAGSVTRLAEMTNPESLTRPDPAVALNAAGAAVVAFIQEGRYLGVATRASRAGRWRIRHFDNGEARGPVYTAIDPSGDVLVLDAGTGTLVAGRAG